MLARAALSIDCFRRDLEVTGTSVQSQLPVILPKSEADLNIMNASDSESCHDEHYAPTQRDRAVLEDEEQEERMLLGQSHSGQGDGSSGRAYQDNDRREDRRERKKERRRQTRGGRRRRKHDKDEDRGLMCEMEEGGSKDDAGSQSSSSSLELDSMGVNSVSTKVFNSNKLTQQI